MPNSPEVTDPPASELAKQLLKLLRRADRSREQVLGAIDDFDPVRMGVAAMTLIGPGLPSHDLRIVRRGRAIPRARYLVNRIAEPRHVRSVVSRTLVEDHLADGDTVVINNCELHVPLLRQVASSIGPALGVRVNCNIFITAAGFTGFVLHADEFDFLVLQLEGVKDWNFFRPIPLPSAAVYVVSDEEAESLGPPTLEVALAAGDVAYVPAGIPHRAQAGRERSIHCTLSLIPARTSDAFAHLAAALRGDPMNERSMPSSDDEAARRWLRDELMRIAQDEALLRSTIGRVCALELTQDGL